MKPRHVYVAGRISDQVACRAACAPAPRTDAWNKAFSRAEPSVPAQKPEQQGRSIIQSCSDDIKILSVRRPDFGQEEGPKKPIRFLTLQDLMLGEDWRVRELEKLVNGGKKTITLTWIAGVTSIAWCVGNMVLNPKVGASPSAIGVFVAVLAATVAIFIKALKYVKKTNSLAEQELEKAREELNAKGEI